MALAPGLSSYECAAQTIRAAATQGAAPAAGMALGAVPLLSAPALSMGAGLGPLAGIALENVKPLVPETQYAADALAAISIAAPEIAALTSGVERIQSVSRDDASGLATRAASALIFEGNTTAASQAEAASVSGERTSAVGASRLGAPRHRKAHDGAQPPNAPRTSLKRSFQVGFLAAAVPLLITTVACGIAESFGYQFHPSYDLGEHVSMNLENLSGLDALKTIAVVSVFTPIAEEIIFRGGVMGGLTYVARKLTAKSAFWLPAALSSAFFVVLHETSDPVLMATRFIITMTWSYAFHKEGILSSMAAHGISNAIMVLPLTATALLGSALGGLASTAALPALIPAAIVVWRRLQARQPDIESGRSAPKAFDARAAGICALILVPGLILFPNVLWSVALLALVNYILHVRRSS